MTTWVPSLYYLQVYKYNSDVLNKSLVLILLTHTPTLFDLCFHSSDLAFISCLVRGAFGTPLQTSVPSTFNRPDSVGLLPLDARPSGSHRTSSSRLPTLRTSSDFRPPCPRLSISPRPPTTLSRHSCQSLVQPTCDSQVVNLPAGLDFFVLPSRHVRTPVRVCS